jgi:DNA-binding response OmpR family regulator
MGADDYIAKPFSSRVVVARVKAVLRRSGALAGETSGVGSGLTFNGWRLDTTRCELYNPQQQAIPLTQGEYGLLLALAQNARRVLNREQLLALTHNESTEVFDRTIDVLIMRLRRKIELNPHQPTLIKTLRGLGYVFSADVTHSDKAA